jgi:hypothetical protein
LNVPRWLFSFVGIAVVFLAGCSGGESVATPTPLPVATAISTSTSTAIPTSTNQPTATNTLTPLPTNTPIPIATDTPSLPTATLAPPPTKTPAPYSVDEMLYAKDVTERIGWYDEYLHNLKSDLAAARDDASLYGDIDWTTRVLDYSIFLGKLSNLVITDKPLPRFTELNNKLLKVGDESWGAVNAVKEAVASRSVEESYRTAEDHTDKALALLKEAQDIFEKMAVPEPKHK